MQKPYYSEDIHFPTLAEQDPDFARLLAKLDGRVDWQDPESLQQLTKSLLKRDFDLTLSLPPDRLCPPVPIRWNYIRWIQGLLATTSPRYTETFDPSAIVTGLDIGAGASCIYGLLACASSPGWRMHGTEIDPHSFSWAKKNVEANRGVVGNRLKLHQTEPEGPLIPIETLLDGEQAEDDDEVLDFVMCNPPFYSSEEDMRRAYEGKYQSPSAVCTGSVNEMIYTPKAFAANGDGDGDAGEGEGGDAGFASKILEESLVLRGKVRWYTCMLGRLVSVHVLVAKIKAAGIENYAVANLTAGRKTRRWAVGWSFGDLRPRNDVARMGDVVINVRPQATEWTVAVPGVEKEELGSKIDGIMSDLGLRWMWREKIQTGVAVTKENVWSRAARRKRKFELMNGVKGKERSAKTDDSDEDEDEEPVALAVKIVCSTARVDIRWLQGTDFLLWESFCGMLKRSLGAREGHKGQGEKMEE